MRPRVVLISLVAAAVAAAAVFWLLNRAPAKRGQIAYDHTKAILDFGPRPAGSAALDSVRGYLSSSLEKSGWATRLQSFERSTSAGNVKFSNLLARFPAGAPWDAVPKALLCAHVDSKPMSGFRFLGADDAASSCGALLEIAAILAKEDPAIASQIEIVFFDGEEAFGKDITDFDGFYGSRHYATQWRTQPVKPAFGILLDMIGHKNLKVEYPADSPGFLADALVDAARKESAASHFSMAPGPIGDDHVPLNLAGIPTIDIIGKFVMGFDQDRMAIYMPWWHTRGDDLSLVSPESLDTSVRVTLRMLRSQLGKSR